MCHIPILNKKFSLIILHMCEAKLAVITNSFNRRDLLEQAVPSLLTSLARLPFASVIVIFDAGSTDGSREYVQELIKKSPKGQIHLVTTQPNEANSFADGCNQAVAQARLLVPLLKWCLFYETDNQFRNPDALLGAVTFLEHMPMIGGVGFTVERFDGKKTGYGCRFPGSLSFAVGQQAASWLHLDDPSEPLWQQDSAGLSWSHCDVVYTSPLLIRYQAWSDSGPMDALSFPFTDSDVEWCWRAHQSGWPMAVLDLPGVVHDNGGSVSKWSGRRVLWFHQSRLRLLRRRFPFRSRILKAMLYFRHTVEILLLLPRSRRSAQARQSLHTRFVLMQGLWNDYDKVLRI